MPAFVNCISCGSELDGNAPYCSVCGEDQRPPRRILHRAIAGILLLAMIMFVVLAVVTGR
jgi:hypothetical protein